MNKKGFILVEALMGIFFVGLISIVFFSIFTLINNQFYNMEIKNDMKYYGETIIERIKAFDDNSDEYILDMNLDEIINNFYRKDDVSITLPLNMDGNFDYKVNINKKDRGNNLWKIIVEVYPKTNKTEIEGVRFEANIPKPEKN